ncbi:MAG TPA: hypothetical protein VF725_13290 [Ktedonobacterales bacterium]
MERPHGRRMNIGRKRLLLAIVVLLCVFLGFEIGVRLLPADTVQYSIETINPAGPDTTVSGTVTNPATIARWRAAMTAQPNEPLIESYLARWQGVGCSSGTIYNASYNFTWHGLPVEVVSVVPSCLGGYQVSSGGIPGWSAYIIYPLPQPKP